MEHYLIILEKTMLYKAVFFILILYIVLFVLRIKAAVKYTRNEQEEWVLFCFYAGKGMIRYEMKVPLVRKENGKLKFKLVKGQGREMRGGTEQCEKLSPEDIVEKLISVRQYLKDHGSTLEDIRKYLNRHNIHAEIEIRLKQGAGDAARTGLICGALWSAAGIIVTHISRHLKITGKRVHITPCYKDKVFEVEACCIFHVRLVHIIVVLKKIYYMKYRIRKKAKKSKKSTGGESND